MKQLVLFFIVNGIFFTGCSFRKGESISNLQDPAGWVEKKSLLMTQVAEAYNPPSINIGDAEKYYWPKVIARFELYGNRDSLANHWLEALKNRSPFHFTLVGMARIMSLYPDAPFVLENKKLLLREVFHRTDSYNAWTAEGTENHINMSRTSGYLFAQHALQFPDEFPDAPVKLAMMKEWLQDWSKQIYQTGTGEWNSSIYEVYNLLGWLNLYDFASDPEVRLMARAVLDAYAVEMALHNHWGITGGSEMRGKGIKQDGRSATDYYYWLWFANEPYPINGFAGSEYIQAIHAATSRYRPHPAIVSLSDGKFKQGRGYYGTKPSYNFELAPFVRQTLWIDSLFTLGNCTNRYGGFTGASYQMVPWKLVIKDTIPLVISGNGVFYNERSGKTRNPYTQSVQYQNILVQLTRVPEGVDKTISTIDSIGVWWAQRTKHDLRLRFPNETHKLDEPIVNFPLNRNLNNRSYITLPITANRMSEPGRYIFNYNGVGVLVLSLNPVQDSLYFSNDRIILETGDQYNQICGFVIEVFHGHLAESHSTSVTKAGNGVVFTSSKGDRINVGYGLNGSYLEPMVDWGYGPVTPVLFSTSPPFSQPDWGEVQQSGREASMLINGREDDHLLEKVVYKGLGVIWKSGRLKVGDGSQILEIHYDKNLPVYKVY